VAFKAEGEMAHGRFKQAEETYAGISAVTKRDGVTERFVAVQAQQALQLAAFGECSQAKNLANSVIAGWPDAYYAGTAALALAVCGDSAGSQKWVEDFLKAHPENSRAQKLASPLIHALALLDKKDTAGAVAALDAAKQYERGGSYTEYPAYWVFYVRGLAYLQMKDADNASAQFQTILDHPGWHPTSELLPLARLGLARAAVLKGDTASAKTSYQDLFAFWKNADPNFPTLLQAKAEYAKLK
jgi:tetratricopeptide (TPR) repeat protein